MFNSRAKGARGENEVAKKLDAWWGGFEVGCHFVRCPLSGGWRNATIRGEFQASGDLMVASAPSWPFCIEIKHREGWAWKNVYAGNKSPVWGWWRQCQDAAKECGKQPLMFFRHNNESWHVFLPEAYGFQCGLWGSGFVDAVGNPNTMMQEAHFFEDMLWRVDYGAELPVLVTADALFDLAPRMLVLPPKTGVRLTGSERKR